MLGRFSDKETRQFLRFCIVGGICWMIDVGVFGVMSEQFNANYQVAQITSYLVSLCVNYLLTIYWTFHTRSSGRLKLELLEESLDVQVIVPVAPLGCNVAVNCVVLPTSTEAVDLFNEIPVGSI